VGRLAAGVAHEIRNPLSSIKGFATYFKERYAEVSEDQEIVKIMIGEVERVNRVIGQLLEFARPVSLSRSPVDIAGLLEESLKQIERQVTDRGCALQRQIADDLGTISADPDRLRQVLLNLYLNALEAMEEGGRLSVEAERVDDGFVCIRVVDTGSGIEADQLAHIFDPYFTTKSSGTGLGLAIAHNISEAHGGKITVRSRPGRGTSVSLLLPDAPGPA
jgi:two-component system sensor histidine kinase HydH